MGEQDVRSESEQTLRAVHDTLDLLESSLRVLSFSESSEPIDLVLRLRRRIIEMSSECPGDKS